jgi:hypothetical protein
MQRDWLHLVLHELSYDVAKLELFRGQMQVVHAALLSL